MGQDISLMDVSRTPQLEIPKNSLLLAVGITLYIDTIKAWAHVTTIQIS